MLNFRATGRATEKAGGNYRYQKSHRIQRLVNTLLPVLPPGDIVAVLEDQKLLACLHPDLGGKSLAELRKLAVVMLVVEAHVAHERGRLAWHGVHLPLHPITREAVRSTCDITRQATVTHGQRRSPRRSQRGGPPLAFHQVSGLQSDARPVVRGRVELPTFRFSGRATSGHPSLWSK